MAPLNIINIPKNYTYLSDYTEDLPDNRYLDKGKTGCGATELAIRNKVPYIIAVPYINLLLNKSEQHKTHLFPIFGENYNDKEIHDYLSNTAIPKIIITSDSLPKLVRDFPIVTDYKLLVDEAHTYLNFLAFKEKATMKFLEVFTKFNKYCLVTATPNDPEYELDEFRDVPRIKYFWEGYNRPYIYHLRCSKSPINTLKFLINAYLNNLQNGNPHIFINSLDLIEKVYRDCKLNETNTRVVYSTSNKSQYSFSRSSLQDPVCQFNFYTSSTFEGADIYDTEGKVFVVSDGNKEHTLVNINTTLIQVAGRLRNTRYKDHLYHLTSGNTYRGDLNFIEFKTAVEQALIEESSQVSTFNAITNIKFKQKCSTIIETLSDFITYDYTSGLAKLNTNKARLDLSNFKLLCTYSNIDSLKDAYKANSLDADTTMSKLWLPNLDNDKTTLKDAVEHIKSNEAEHCDVLGYYKKYPFLKEAISLLGVKEIERLKYHAQNIKFAVDKKKAIVDPKLIKNRLKRKNVFYVGSFVPFTDAKQLLGEIYAELDIKIKPKATDLIKYLSLKQTVRKGVNGFMVISTD